MMSLYFLFLWASAVIQYIGAVRITGSTAGVNTLTGERPIRQNINELQSSGPAFDLYILALQQMEQQSQNSELSYYQVAGIHGLPYVEWDGVSGQYLLGYCTHQSILFPSWHRPYLALFEVRSNIVDDASSARLRQMNSKFFRPMHSRLRVNTQRSNALSIKT